MQYIGKARVLLIWILALVLLYGCATLKGKSYSEQGNFYFAKNNFNKAVEYFTKAIETDSENAEYLTMLGWSYFKLGSYDWAIAAFERLSSREPKAVDAYTGMGWSNFKKGNFDAAIGHFNQALDVDKHSSDAYSGLGWSNFRKNDLEQAENYFNLALSKGMRYKKGSPLKTEPEAHRGLGYLNFSKGNFKTAKEHFRKACMLMPDWNDARLKWGDSLLALAKFKEAIKVYKYGLNYAKTPEVYDKIGWGYLKAKNLKLARNMFSQALKIDPVFQSSLAGLAELEKEGSAK